MFFSWATLSSAKAGFPGSPLNQNRPLALKGQLPRRQNL
jgi:hypothetical protein